MGKHLTECQIGKIIAYRDGKHPFSYQQIANKLNKPRSTIYAAYKRVINKKNISRKPGSGRPRKITKTERNRIKILLCRNPYLSTREIKEELNLNCGRTTVNDTILELGFPPFLTTSKPNISRRNKRKRVEWAKKYVHWTSNDWKRVLFADESKFELRYKKRRRVRRRRGQKLDPQFISPTVKTEKNIKVWGCFAFDGVGTLHRFEGILNAKKYHGILQRKMLPSMRILIKSNDKYYHQDNDTNYLLNKQILQTLPPPQSPDLNPIENLWSYLDDMCKDRKCKNENELFNDIQKAWNKIPSWYLRGLIESMPRRCQAVIDKHGGNTKY